MFSPNQNLRRRAQTSIFFRLPRELRDEIYTWAMQVSGRLYFNEMKRKFSTKPDRYESPNLNLLLVCFQIAEESMLLPFKVNELCFGLCALSFLPFDEFEPFEEFGTYLKRLWVREAKLGLRADIRRVHIVTYVRLTQRQGVTVSYGLEHNCWEYLPMKLGFLAKYPRMVMDISVRFGTDPKCLRDSNLNAEQETLQHWKTFCDFVNQQKNANSAVRRPENEKLPNVNVIIEIPNKVAQEVRQVAEVEDWGQFLKQELVKDDYSMNVYDAASRNMTGG